ncbi:hypothetical protein D3C76_399690 [compost metagenome]
MHIANVGLGVKRFDGMEALFVTRQEGGQVRGMGQVQGRAAQALVDPGQALFVEGVGEHPDQFVAQLDHDEFALDGLGQGNALEYRSGGKQAFAVEHRVMQGAAQAAGEFAGGQRREGFEALQGAFTLFAGNTAGLLQDGAGETQWRGFRQGVD